MKTPYELWVEANGDRDRYLALMREHGHIIPGKPEPLPCGWEFGAAASEHRCTLDGDRCWKCGDYWPCVTYTDSLGI